MKSNRLSFNRAVAGDVARRCWPFWAVYLGYLIVSFTISIVSYVQRSRWGSEGFLYNGKELIFTNARLQAQAGFVVAILAVMLLFGYLYSSRGNTLINSIPVTRESIFLTIYLMGLGLVLLCQVLVTGLTMLLTFRSGLMPGLFLQWFCCSALSFIAFYGFAGFCAMLTGNILILPMVYAVLNLTAYVFELCVRACLSTLVYGMADGKMRFYFLSPIVSISDGLKVVRNDPFEIRLEGLGLLAVYALTGLVFAVLAMRLYRKRRMETVSDFVAIPVLKPIFRYCMGFGTAFVLAAFLFSNFFQKSVFGTGAAWLMAGLLVTGAFLGWLAAEMMVRRSVRVLPLPWKGLALVCAVCVLTVLAAETDITGFERRVPKPEDVLRVEFNGDTLYEEPANIRAITELHRQMIQEKAVYEKEEAAIGRGGTAEYPGREGTGSFRMPLSYQMKDGHVVNRTYTIWFQREEVDQPESTIGQARAIMNTAEGIRSRMTPPIPIEEPFVNYAVINRESDDGDMLSYRLTPRETVELWNTAMLADAADGHLSLYTIADTDENMSTQTDLRIEINLYDETRTRDPYYWYHSYRVFTFSEHCLEWIEAHTDLEWVTLDQARKQPYGDDAELVLPTAFGIR